jgi:hypothetical protein
MLDALGSFCEVREAGTALSQRSQRRICLSRLQKLQTDIVKTVTERRVELEVLHRRVRGQLMARRFLGTINTRWKPLNNLVAAYNAEVQRYNKHVDKLLNVVKARADVHKMLELSDVQPAALRMKALIKKLAARVGGKAALEEAGLSWEDEE